jgi:uncharacterized membrane protein
MTGAAIIIVLVGLLIVWIAIRSWQGRLSRNYIVGIRTPSTMRSDEAFRIANKTAAPFSLAAGLLFIVGGAVTAVAPHDTASAVLPAGVVIAAIVAVVGGVKGVRAARAAP